MKVLKPTASNVHRAAGIIQRGGLVAFPTETVYGLGADAFNEKAVCKIFEVKKRPSFDPLIVHVANPRDAVLLWRQVPDIAKVLMEKFWPGPLSIVLPKNINVPDVVTSGLATVAVRMPDHPVALRLIREAGCPIAAPSANLFGYTSPTQALAVAEDLGGKIGAVLDGGPSKVGVESTVVKIEHGKIFILRPGGITVEQIEKAAGLKVVRNCKISKKESPGQMKSHYAPKTPLVLMGGGPAGFVKKMERFKKDRLAAGQAFPDIACISFFEKYPKGLFGAHAVLSPKKDLYAAASQLFQAIRKLDKMAPCLIVAAPFPAKGIGLAIRDRLEKASGGKQGWNSFLHLINRKPKGKNK